MIPTRCLAVWLVFVGAIFIYYFTFLLVYTDVPYSDFSLFKKSRAASSAEPSVGDDASWLSNDNINDTYAVKTYIGHVPQFVMSMTNIINGEINSNNNFDRCNEKGDETARRQALNLTTAEDLAAAERNLTSEYIQLPTHSDDFVYGLYYDVFIFVILIVYIILFSEYFRQSNNLRLQCLQCD